MLIACYSFVHRCCDTHVIIGSFLNACQLVTWRRRRIVWFFAEMLPVPTCALSLVRGTEMFWNSLPEWYCKLLLPTPWKKYGFFPEWYCCLQLRLALQLLILRKENTSVLLIRNVVSFFWNEMRSILFRVRNEPRIRACLVPSKISKKKI